MAYMGKSFGLQYKEYCHALVVRLLLCDSKSSCLTFSLALTFNRQTLDVCPGSCGYGCVSRDRLCLCLVQHSKHARLPGSHPRGHHGVEHRSLQ